VAERHRVLGALTQVDLERRLAAVGARTPAPPPRSSGSDRRGQEMPYSTACQGGIPADEDGGDDNDSEHVEQDACSICLDPFEQSTTVKKLRCGHFYHPDCIDVWLEVSPRCPLCRQDWRRGCRDVSRAASNIELTVLGSVTSMNFTAMLHPEVRFGVTIAATGNGLLVTYVEPEGAGAEQMVEVGDYLVRQDGELVQRGISDAAFVAALVALARPVELGFSRQVRAEERPPRQSNVAPEEEEDVDLEAGGSLTQNGVSEDDPDDGGGGDNDDDDDQGSYVEDEDEVTEPGTEATAPNIR